MAQLPRLPRLPPNPYLAAWLHEWNLAESLRDLDPPAYNPWEGSPAELPSSPAPAGERVAVGQIRLLSRRLLPASERPVYVAVLSEWEDGLQLVAPFSAFLSPATPGELLTARTEAALRVLCLWNARSVPTAFLAAGSWLADDLSLPEIDEAWAVFLHVTTGSALLTELITRTGAPTIRADDPRVRYQQEEAALLAPLTEAARRHEHWSWLRAADRPDLALAADRPGNDARIVMREYHSQAPAGGSGDSVSVSDVRVTVFFTSATRWLTLVVTDTAGRPAPSLDGVLVCDTLGGVLATIRDSQAQWDAGLAHEGITLQQATGQPLPLSPQPSES